MWNQVERARKLWLTNRWRISTSLYPRLYTTWESWEVTLPLKIAFASPVGCSTYSYKFVKFIFVVLFTSGFLDPYLFSIYKKKTSTQSTNKNLSTFYSDSSKQRQKLRRKVSQEKDCLKEALNRYNELVSNDRKAKKEEIEKGEFPWQLFDNQLTGNGKATVHFFFISFHLHVFAYRNIHRNFLCLHIAHLVKAGRGHMNIK